MRRVDMSDAVAGPFRIALLAGVLLVAFATLPPIASATELPSTIAENTTLTTAGSPYTAGEVTIAAGVTVEVEPGVRVVGIKELARIFVKGTLKAEGTTGSPIVFTGPKNEKAGEWRGLVFEPGSGSSTLNHVEVAYGGHLSRPAIEINDSSPSILNSTIRGSANGGINIPKGGSPNIGNDSVIGSAKAAIQYIGPKESTGEVNIHGNYVEGGTSGISAVVEGNATIVGKALSGNTVVGTSGGAISYSGTDIPGDITENSASGNAFNRISVQGTLAHSATWNVSPGGLALWLSKAVTIASGVTLTVSPGVRVVGAEEFSRIFVKGTLKAEGTTGSPIVFTGPKNEKAGEWRGLVFEPGSGSSTLNHVEVAYAGYLGEPNIEINDSSPSILNSTIRGSANGGIKVTGLSTPVIEWNLFRGNKSGLSFTGTGKLSARNNDWECASGPKPAGCGNSVTSNIEWRPALQLPEFGGHCRSRESQCPEGADPVSLATGQLSYSHEDLLLTNKSEVPLEFTRTYSSGSSADTGLGPGWSQTGLASATELQSGNEVLIQRQDGRQDLFEKTESGYQAPSGVTDALAKVEGSFELTTLNGTVYSFDSSGRIASVTDSHGLETVYAYSSDGRLATITDPSSQTLTFSYNASNHITLIKDSTGREIKFSYSAVSDLEAVTDALGGVTKYAYDPQHRLVSITDPRGNVILQNSYNGEGKITEQEDGLGHLWKLEYKPSETIITEPEGGEKKYGFDGQDRVVSETNQLGHTTTTSYDEAGNVHEVLQPGGAKWIFGHDAVGNLISVKDAEGGERKYEYNAQNRPITFTDSRGNTWNYEWSKAGDLERISNPEGGETTFAYNASGQPLTKTDPDKHKTEFSYDSRGNELSETDPLSHKSSFEYNSRNYLIAKIAPGLKAEKLERDAYGDLLARTTPEGHTTKYAYDKNGLPIQITDPGEDVWEIDRNAMERPTVYTDPAEQQVKISYNGDLKPSKVVNRRGKETTYAYDLANRLSEADFPEGGDWKFGYDARGNRASLIDPREHETTYEYDLLNRMTKASEPLGVTTEYEYDANGNLTSVKDPRGNTTSYGYDKLGRLTEVAQPLEKTTTYAYDAAGNPLSKTTAAGTLEYAYDADNHLAEVKAGESTLRSLGYNADNLLSSATDVEGHKIEVGHNEDGLASSIKDGRGQSLTRSYNSRGELTKEVDGRGTLEYGYDKLGRLTSLTDPQGKSLGFGYGPEGDLTKVTRPNGVTTTNVYNDAGRLAETTSVEAGELPTTLESLKYGYDAAGNVTSKIDQRLEQETTYAYDPLNRITELNPPGEGATSYGYDKAGNRTEADGTTYAFNALNQLTEASDGTTYSYDDGGRMIGKVKGAEETSYDWNLLDRLTKVETPAETTSYVYDGLERLSERKGSGGTQVIHYGDLSDLPNYVANGEGETSTIYVQGAHGLIEQRSGEATSFPLTDAHGDVTTITSAAGEVESRQAYDPSGEQLSGPGLEMGYLGAWERPTDPASGLIQMGARLYSPTLGSFVTEDPVFGRIGIGASVDRYPYVWNNPLNYYDLNGRETCVSTPFGSVCPVKDIKEVAGGAGMAWHGIEKVGTGVSSAAEHAWDLTAPGRSLIANQAQDFWKEYGSALEGAYGFAGAHWRTCGEVGAAGGLGGATIGSFLGPPGAAIGAVVGAGGGCAAGVGTELLLE